MTFLWRTFLHNTFRIVFVSFSYCFHVLLEMYKVDMKRIQKQYKKCYVNYFLGLLC